ncbi:hypothetical protein [Parasitella parasitica]|uniref:C3H1-type domain-containing protein n=1 Tax=Parasitella parasitica TaxID=35722 RepID=A0A0B7N0A9_9FUNG|nr:hypothetical protein [Parasitella parasitica]
MTIEKQQQNSTVSGLNPFDFYNEENQLSSRSVPGSRRNSNDEKSLFPPHNLNDAPVDFMMKPPPRSFSIDVGSIHHNTNDYSSILFSNENDSSAAPSFQPNVYLQQRYSNSNNNNSSGSSYNNKTNTANYGLQFNSPVSELDLDSTLRRNSTRSVESLRSKSWAQFLENNNHSSSNAQHCYSQQQQQQQERGNPLDMNTHDVQAAFYGQPARRFSHGWASSNVNRMQDKKYDHFSVNDMKASSLSASYSYSDLHTGVLGPHRINEYSGTSANAVVPDNICQQFTQYGYCNLKEQCPYSHVPSIFLQQNNLLLNDHIAAAAASIMAYSTSNTATITTSPTSNAAHFFANQHPQLRYSSSESTVNVNMDSFYSNATNLPVFNVKPLPQLIDNHHQQQQRRTSGSTNTDPELNKYTGASLEEFEGNLFELCKDQNGCRFLQTKLEESSMNVTLIYEEIHTHFVDLMTDPFGNYLCQKLLERCDDAQRTSIVDVIAPEFLKICLSMHGTRAVQKLIEFLSTKRQIQAVITALKPNVVALIKDLNGNHVIQKCLHKLSSEHNQFIYDTVSEHCIQVASHKHGCCVYQRCIDYAVESQKVKLKKIQLVNVITQHALPLVQDPFGNYVVQYVLGLEDATYYDNLIRRFIEPIRELSLQKFSSNVIEKCIRVAGKETRRLLIAGIIDHPNMERFLRDSYANYVIQTCLDCAEEDQRIKFVECIRPLLPSIRNTPYGKRIYSKIHRDINNGTRSIALSSSTTRHLHYPHYQRSMLDDSSTTNSTNLINEMNSLRLNLISASPSTSNTATTTADNSKTASTATAYL